MKRILTYILPLILGLGLLSCGNASEDGAGGAAQAVSDLLGQASKDITDFHFEAATEKALEALKIAQEDGSPGLQVRAMHTLVGLDIMSTRDNAAWKKAVEAEELAREHGLKEELADILVDKAKLCSYAEISPETGRNDEGLGYAMEALSLAEDAGALEQQCEACYAIASLYINKNRWSDPIDQQLYNKAGEYLDRGQAIADTNRFARLQRNGLMFRSRWFQQGDRNEEAIRYFEQARSSLKGTDYLTLSSIDDRLVRLYTRVGKGNEALDAHDRYVHLTQLYMKQKADDTLQEMETRFEVQEKEHSIERKNSLIAIITLALLLAAAAILLAIKQIRIIRHRNRELERISAGKKQLLDEERNKTIAELGLSKREYQIIQLSAEGLTAAEIADKLFLSVHTVNTHRQRIYAKMDVKNVADMLRQARSLGII